MIGLSRLLGRFCKAIVFCLGALLFGQGQTIATDIVLTGAKFTRRRVLHH